MVNIPRSALVLGCIRAPNAPVNIKRSQLARQKKDMGHTGLRRRLDPLLDARKRRFSNVNGDMRLFVAADLLLVQPDLARLATTWL